MANDKYKELLKDIPATLKMRLDNIKSYLYFNRAERKIGSASLMIGSGFSKNADKGVDANMLDWNELGKKFYHKLYGKEPTSEDLMYSSPIKLATMVEAEFGRTIIDKMIQDSLPDDRVFPNSLYRDLLNLPWHDVFTTNYDRLLERTEMLDGITRHYNVVTNKETLIYTPSPRIVKLHGSFPDIHPYIITEEDFRTYPKKYPEFVNTVRQSLVENLFCLIGFSGDDPNFLSWIGWMRDVMGRLSMPVYLITFDRNIHGAQIQLYQRRNIQVVNLIDIPGIKTYREAFEFLFMYLKESKHSLWKCNLQYQLDTKDNIKTFISKASKIRKSYPGWIVLPEKYFRDFDECISFYDVENSLSLINEEKLKINLLFEFDWQLYISLTPRNIDWYINELQQIELRESDDSNIYQRKLWLMISLLNIYRHSGDKDNFERLKNELECIMPKANDELQMRYYNEIALWYLANLEYEKTLHIMQNWQPVRSNFKSRILKATILDECGQEKTAIEELRKLKGELNTERQSDNTSSKFYLDSCLQRVSSLINVYDFNHYNKDENNEEINIIGIQSIASKLKDKVPQQYSHGHGFRINTHTTQWTFGGNEFISDFIGSYRLLTYFEESGYTFGHYKVSTEEKNMTLAISHIIEYESQYAIGAIVRTCNDKVLKAVLTRNVINNIDIETINKIFGNYLFFTGLLETEQIASRSVRDKFCFKLLSRLAIKTNEEHVSTLFRIMLNNIQHIGIWFSKDDFYEVFDCLSTHGLEEFANRLYVIPYTKKNETSFDLPDLPKGQFKIEDSMLTFLEDGLIRGDKRSATQAYQRITCIFSNLSNDDKKRLEISIFQWRNCEEQSYEMRESYQYFPYSESEEIKIDAVANNEIDKINVDEYKVIGGSPNPISRFRMKLRSIGPIAKYADGKHKDMLLEKIVSFFRSNEDTLKKDNRKVPMGSYHSSMNYLLYTIHLFICDNSFANCSKEVFENLFSTFIRYAGYDYHDLFITAFAAKQLGKLELLKPYITKRLFTRSVEGATDKLSSLVLVMDNSFDQNLMSKIESYIEFASSEDVSKYINFVWVLVKDEIYPLKEDYEVEVSTQANFKSRVGQLEALLLNIANNVMSTKDIINAADIEFETLRLVRQVVAQCPEFKDSDALKIWKKINESENTFNDVRIWR